MVINKILTSANAFKIIIFTFYADNDVVSQRLKIRIFGSLACEKIRFFSLVAAGDVSLGPLDTFPATKSEKKRMFSQAIGSKKLPCVFNFPVSRVRPERIVRFLFAATSNHVQVRLDCTSRIKIILRQQRREK